MIKFDCHAHVYESIAAVPGARYVPERLAPLSEWLGHQQDNGLQGGVIVQVSFLGTDNSELCAALARLDRTRFAGVGVVPLDVADEDLDDLVAKGVRGLRWNLVRNAQIPDLREPITQVFFAKLRARNLHLELHLEGPRLASHLATMVDQGVNLVVDHFGLPSEPHPRDDPMISAVSRLKDVSNLFFKFSAHYRTPFDLHPHAQALLKVLEPDHIVWGSDWPHTQYEGQIEYDETRKVLSNWGNWLDERSVHTLYGIVPAP